MYTYFNVSHSMVAFLLVPLAINILNFYWIHTELINIVGSFGDTTINYRLHYQQVLNELDCSAEYV